MVMDNQAEGTTTGESRTIRCAVIDGAQLIGAAGIESARLDAEVLLCHVLKMEKAEFYFSFDSPLDLADRQKYQELLMRRAKREPLAYITARKEFWSLDFVVTPDVLIPRPETELLVELVLQRATLASRKSPLKVLDIGTGSGVIAVSLAKELPQAEIWAVDVSAAALNIAGINSRQHGVASRIQFLQGDVFGPVSGLGLIFDVIVSNPPYVRSRELSDLAPEICHWEPTTALDGGPDGLDACRRIIYGADKYLAPKGHLLLEIGDDMGKAAAELFACAGDYGTVSVYQDYAGRDRVIAATKMSRLDQQSFSHG